MAKTLEEIAQLAGVSRSTVSRVINHHPSVRDEVRERVLRVIRETDYQPNRAARSLASRRSQVVGLVIPQSIHAVFTDPYFSILIEGVARACNRRNYAIVLGLITPEMQDPYRHLVKDGFLDGIIVASAIEGDPFVARLRQDNLPFITVGRLFDSNGISYVDVDNVGGATSAVLHLLRKGYRRIATITGPQNMIAGANRYEGYVKALKTANLPLDPALVVEGQFNELSGTLAMQDLLALDPMPEAVFAASDMMAIGALTAIREAGLRVPEDIALVGYDDIPLAAQLTPGLTTVRQPIAQLGATAADLLIDALEGGEPLLQRVVLPTELVIRSSCGQTAGRFSATSPAR